MHAEQLRERAEHHAVGIPEASTRAEVHQQEALHEDQIRAADRLDPAVDQ